MNEKHKEAFEKWYLEYPSWVVTMSRQESCSKAWQAACEYRDKNNITFSDYDLLFNDYKKPQAENAKLRECVESFVDKYFDLPLGLRLQKGIKEGKESLRARQVLKEDFGFGEVRMQRFMDAFGEKSAIVCERIRQDKRKKQIR